MTQCHGHWVPPDRCGLRNTGRELVRPGGMPGMRLFVGADKVEHVLHVEPLDRDSGKPLDPDLSEEAPDSFLVRVPLALVSPIDVTCDDLKDRLGIFLVNLSDLTVYRKKEQRIGRGAILRRICTMGEGRRESDADEEAIDPSETIALQKGLVARSIGIQVTHDPERRDKVLAGVAEDIARRTPDGPEKPAPGAGG